MSAFREETVREAALIAIAAGKSGPEAYDVARQSYDAVASILGDTIRGEFWDELKAHLGIDPELSCCPICAGVTPPSKHLHCLSQLGEWPAKGTRYNDDV